MAEQAKAQPPKPVKPKKYQSVGKQFAFRVGPADESWDPKGEDPTKGNGLLYFESGKDTVVKDPAHIAICDSYVPRVLFDVTTDEQRRKAEESRGAEEAKRAQQERR